MELFLHPFQLIFKLILCSQQENNAGWEISAKVSAVLVSWFICKSFFYFFRNLQKYESVL